MKGSILAFQLLGLLQLCKSQTPCTSDVAVPIDDSTTSSAESGSGSDPGAAAIASYQVAGASAIVDLTGTNLGGGSGGPADLIDTGSDPLRRLLRKRATLECTSSESCYSLQGSPFCVNDQTNDFRLEDGTTGNLVTGDYTLTDGQEGNLNTGPYPTLPATSVSTTFEASAASATGLSDYSTITETAGSAATTSASTRTTITPSESAGSTGHISTPTESVSSTEDISTPTESASSVATAGTGTSPTNRTSTLRGSTSGTNAAVSPTTSLEVFVNAAGAPTRYWGSNLVLLAAMGLRAML